jgi:pimeloyl-ACP methyl ester carboxylesterase
MPRTVREIADDPHPGIAAFATVVAEYPCAVGSGFRRREIAGNGVRLSFLDNDADGPVVVALHGLAGATSSSRQPPRSAAPTGSCSPTCAGTAAAPGGRPADLSRDAFTADVAAVIGRVSADRPVTRAGQSVGGHTAILAAAAFPDLVERLVVLETTVAGGADPGRIGDYFRSWPVPFGSATEAAEFRSTPT